jgi:diguanylate cyclase (GGDEF)-like protein
MGELVRAIGAAVAQSDGGDGFFMQLSGGSVDIRDRIARHLDDALFESVIASEVRALAKHDTFEQFFDNFSQFLSRIVRYRWVAVRTAHGAAVHHHPADTAPVEARHALAMPSDAPLLSVVDEDACHEPVGVAPIVRTIALDDRACGIIAFAPSADEPDSTALIDLIARELGLPLRISALMEESRRMATTDPLTRLMNRRAFSDLLQVELSRSRRYVLPLSQQLLDIERFKSINDTHGHGAGDSDIRANGELLRPQCRISDAAARWGAEEFVVSLTNTDLAGAQTMAERIRAAVEKLEISHEGQILRVTASIGATSLAHEVQLETFIERADRAMYEAKQSGRNRVCALGPISVAPPARAEDAQAAS